VTQDSSANEAELGVADYQFLDSKYNIYELKKGDELVESKGSRCDGTSNIEESLKANEMTDLALKIRQLDARMEKVELKLFSGSMEKLNFGSSSGTIATPMSSGQMTGMGRNEGIVAEIKACFRVLKEHRFATCQSLVLVAIVTAMVSFAIMQFSNVDESGDSLYKPIKIAGKDEFYLNEELDYTIPKHYFLIHMQGATIDIPRLYNDAFNENCEGSLVSCLTGYMNDFLTDPGDPGITASCDMVAADEETGLLATAEIELRDLSLYADEIGTARWNGTGKGVFGVLLKLEFESLPTHMNGPLSCSIGLDIRRINEMLPGFGYNIYFMVSRTDEDSGLTGFSQYLDSWSQLWRYDDIVTKNFVYVYEESTIDTQSKFQAEIYVENKVLSSLVTSLSLDTLLTIETYPNPSIVHYVTYDNYTYMDWLADMGGYLSIAVGFFVFMATRITKLAHRGEVFHTHHGILPIFSLPHRNAEELARLRFIVLENLGVTVEEYFGKSYQKHLTARINNSFRGWNDKINDGL